MAQTVVSAQELQAILANATTTAAAPSRMTLILAAVASVAAAGGAYLLVRNMGVDDAGATSFVDGGAGGEIADKVKDAFKKPYDKGKEVLGKASKASNKIKSALEKEQQWVSDHVDSRLAGFLNLPSKVASDELGYLGDTASKLRDGDFIGAASSAWMATGGQVLNVASNTFDAVSDLFSSKKPEGNAKVPEVNFRRALALQYLIGKPISRHMSPTERDAFAHEVGDRAKTRAEVPAVAHYELNRLISRKRLPGLDPTWTPADYSYALADANAEFEQSISKKGPRRAEAQEALDWLGRHTHGSFEQAIAKTQKRYVEAQTAAADKQKYEDGIDARLKAIGRSRDDLKNFAVQYAGDDDTALRHMEEDFHNQLKAYGAAHPGNSDEVLRARVAKHNAPKFGDDTEHWLAKHGYSDADLQKYIDSYHQRKPELSEGVAQMRSFKLLQGQFDARVAAYQGRHPGLSHDEAEGRVLKHIFDGN